MTDTTTRRIVILGAAGRDFHNFNVVYRDDPAVTVVAFTATQMEALRATIDRVDADIVIAATPVDLTRLMALGKRVIRARYEFAETAEPGLGAIVDDWLNRPVIVPKMTPREAPGRGHPR